MAALVGGGGRKNKGAPVCLQGLSPTPSVPSWSMVKKSRQPATSAVVKRLLNVWQEFPVVRQVNTKAWQTPPEATVNSGWILEICDFNEVENSQSHYNLRYTSRGYYSLSSSLIIELVIFNVYWLLLFISLLVSALSAWPSWPLGASIELEKVYSMVRGLAQRRFVKFAKKYFGENGHFTEGLTVACGL